VTELARPGEAGLGRAEAQEWGELGEEGWVALKPVRVRKGNASALNAGQVSPMK
jgi:hypothetical protein